MSAMVTVLQAHETPEGLFNLPCIESIEIFSQKQQQQSLISIANHPNYFLHENRIFL